MAQYSARVGIFSRDYKSAVKVRTFARVAVLTTVTNTVTIIEKVEVPINTRPRIGVIFPRGMK